MVSAGVLCYPAQIRSLACWRKINRIGPEPSEWVLHIAGPFCFTGNGKYNGYRDRVANMVSNAFRLPVRIVGETPHGSEINVRVMVPADVLAKLVREVYLQSLGQETL